MLGTSRPHNLVSWVSRIFVIFFIPQFFTICAFAASVVEFNALESAIQVVDFEKPETFEKLRSQFNSVMEKLKTDGLSDKLQLRIQSVKRKIELAWALNQCGKDSASSRVKSVYKNLILGFQNQKKLEKLDLSCAQSPAPLNNTQIENLLAASEPMRADQNRLLGQKLILSINREAIETSQKLSNQFGLDEKKSFSLEEIKKKLCQANKNAKSVVCPEEVINAIDDTYKKSHQVINHRNPRDANPDARLPNTEIAKRLDAAATLLNNVLRENDHSLEGRQAAYQDYLNAYKTVLQDDQIGVLIIHGDIATEFKSLENFNPTFHGLIPAHQALFSVQPEERFKKTLTTSAHQVIDLALMATNRANSHSRYLFRTGENEVSPEAVNEALDNLIMTHPHLVSLELMKEPQFLPSVCASLARLDKKHLNSETLIKEVKEWSEDLGLGAGGVALLSCVGSAVPAFLPSLPVLAPTCVVSSGIATASGATRTVAMAVDGLNAQEQLQHLSNVAIHQGKIADPTEQAELKKKISESVSELITGGVLTAGGLGMVAMVSRLAGSSGKEIVKGITTLNSPEWHTKFKEFRRFHDAKEIDSLAAVLVNLEKKDSALYSELLKKLKTIDANSLELKNFLAELSKGENVCKL